MKKSNLPSVTFNQKTLFVAKIDLTAGLFMLVDGEGRFFNWVKIGLCE